MHQFLTLLWWLVVGHAVADFVVQSDTIALSKNRNLPNKTGVPWQFWLSAHALVHGGAVTLILVSPILGACEAVAHWAIDFGKCENWYDMATDQLFHLARKILWLLVSMSLLGLRAP